MASLTSCQGCSPAEDLHPSREERSQCAHRASHLRRSGKRKFMMARRSARKAVREAKNKWFQVKAAQAMRGKNNGKVVWKCIRDIQRSRRGLVPVRTPTVEGCVAGRQSP